MLAHLAACPATPDIPLAAEAAEPCLPKAEPSTAGFVPARSEARYLEDVDRIFEALRRGDSYEVCLTTQARATSPRA